MSSLDRIVHSRLVVTSIEPGTYTLSKTPETSISIKQEDVLTGKYEEKYSELTNEDAEILEKCFIHKIKVFPFYDYKSDSQETNAVLNELKQNDLEIEVYPDAIHNNDDIINRCLEAPTSVIIVDGFGVITLKCVESDLLSANNELAERFKNQLKNRDVRDALISSPQLTDEEQNLKINHIDAIVFETENEVLMGQMNDRLVQVNYPVRVFNLKTLIEFLRSVTDSRKDLIDDKKRIGIVQSLLPKYSNSKTINITKEPLIFTPDGTFELDDIQKETLSHLNERTYIKASAGSGKTILLLAKAYEVAKANPKKQFLLLCYNNELSKDIQNQADNTGRNISNLKISTLDKFLIDLGIPPHDTAVSSYSVRKKTFVQQVMSGKINLSYGGIFVDEVQQMRQEWLDALLECTDDKKYMIISGDYYQSINPSLLEEDEDEDFIDEGDSTDYVIDGYEFKSLILDKNYRNTKSIAKVLKNMVTQMNNASKELDVSIKREKVIGHAYKESIVDPYYIKVGGAPQEKIECVSKQVDLLIDKYDCAPSDILLVCPGPDNWLFYLEKELTKKYEVYNFTGSSRHGDKAGIKMGTIGKSIGLDFKAVVFYNTSTIKYLFKDRNANAFIEDFDALKSQPSAVKKKYLSLLRHIYVACSRARSILIVLDDGKDENLFTKFLKESGLEVK